MSEQRGVLIGQCGCLVPVEESGWVIAACTRHPARPAAPRRRDYLAQLRAAVEDLARSRYLLGDVIELADEVDADTITDAELRDRLTALADRARTCTEPRPAAG